MPRTPHPSGSQCCGIPTVRSSHVVILGVLGRAIAEAPLTRPPLWKLGRIAWRGSFRCQTVNRTTGTTSISPPVNRRHYLSKVFTCVMKIHACFPLVTGMRAWAGSLRNGTYCVKMAYNNGCNRLTQPPIPTRSCAGEST